MTTTATLTYAVADFEHPAQCVACGRELPPGVPYATTDPEASLSPGAPMVYVLCVYCPTKP